MGAGWPMGQVLGPAAALVLLASASELVVVQHGKKSKDRRSAVLTVEDIQRRVVAAGGKPQGVLAVSLAWSTPDDLDLHMVLPGEGEISYHNRRQAGGELDVDMCVQGRAGSHCKERPVENVVFMNSAPAGKYKIYVQNYNYHADVKSRAVQASDVLNGQRKKPEGASDRASRFGRERNVKFDVLVKVEDQHHIFSSICTPAGKTHKESNVRVFEFEYLPGLKPVLMPSFEAAANPECGVKLQLPGGEGAGRQLPGSSGGRPAQTSSSRAAPSARAGGAGGGGQRKTKQSKAKESALAAVRSSGRSGLSAKPPGALQSLLRDLGTACRGCLDKSELVDKLLSVAGVGTDEL